MQKRFNVSLKAIFKVREKIEIDHKEIIREISREINREIIEGSRE